jgi:hypothetical protein
MKDENTFMNTNTHTHIYTHLYRAFYITQQSLTRTLFLKTKIKQSKKVFKSKKNYILLEIR